VFQQIPIPILISSSTYIQAQDLTLLPLILSLIYQTISHEVSPCIEHWVLRESLSLSTILLQYHINWI